MTKLIGLCGAARSGKDTVAKYMVQECGFLARAFADPMYDMLQAGFGIHVEGHDEMPREWRAKLPYMLNVSDGNKNDEIRPFGCSVRRFMQTLGTEWGRECIDEHIWVQLADVWYSQHHHSNVVFTDVRFPNEAEFIINNGGHLLEIYRNQEDFAAFRTHISENNPLQDYVDHTIDNNGPLPFLYESVDRALSLYE